MTTPVTPVTQAAIDAATSVLDQVATGLQGVAAALPALLAGDSAVDISGLQTAVTDVVTAANAVTALLPASTAEPA